MISANRGQMCRTRPLKKVAQESAMPGVLGHTGGSFAGRRGVAGRHRRDLVLLADPLGDTPPGLAHHLTSAACALTHWPQNQKPEAVLGADRPDLRYLSLRLQPSAAGGLGTQLPNFMQSFARKAARHRPRRRRPVAPKKIPRAGPAQYETAMKSLEGDGARGVGLGEYDFDMR